MSLKGKRPQRPVKTSRSKVIVALFCLVVIVFGIPVGVWLYISGQLPSSLVAFAFALAAVITFVAGIWPLIGNPLQDLWHNTKNLSRRAIILTVLAAMFTVSVSVVVVKQLPASPSLNPTQTVTVTSTAATTASSTPTSSSLQTIKLNMVMESANTNQLEVRGDSITFDIPHQRAEFDFTVTNKGYYLSSCSFSIDNDHTTYLHEGSTDNKYPLLAGTTWSNMSTGQPLRKFITFGNLSQSPQGGYELNISIVITNCSNENGLNTYSEIFTV